MVIPELWYKPLPKGAVEMTTHGAYEQGYPRGAVVHYTAGRSAGGASAVAYDHGLSYFIIDKDGEVYQRSPLNRWGSHAGESFWPSLGSGVSRSLVGIEVVCAGKLESRAGTLLAWWGDVVSINDANVVYDPEHDSSREPTDNRAQGFYERFTSRQEHALTALLVWLKMNNPDVFDLGLVLGHDEVSPGRKQDPGGSLSVSMPEFRGMLDREYRMKK